MLLYRAETFGLQNKENGSFSSGYLSSYTTQLQCLSASVVQKKSIPPLPPSGATTTSVPGPPHCRSFTITLRHTTVGRTPLDEWSARRRDLYLTTHNTHKRQTSMPPVGFEPTISACERPQTYALDRAVTGPTLAYVSDINNYHYERKESLLSH